MIVAPKGAIAQVGSKSDVRPVSVRPLSHEITTLWDLENPYLVPESAFVLVHFWHLGSKDLSDVGHDTQSLTGLSHVLD